MKKKHVVFVILSLVAILMPLTSIGQELLNIYAPPTPSSIPIIIAAQNMENTEVTIFSNHSQAHTLFLRGDIPILVTGLSVGINFFERHVPIQIINSYVSGLTYLVTRGRKVENFRELLGQELYLPFEGSPIEEVTKFFVEQEGLQWKKDFKVVYSPFPASLELLKRGKAQVVVLPQPLAILAAAQEDIFLSFGYKARWDALTNGTSGYPQVGAFVKKAWADQHQAIITSLNKEIVNALRLIDQNPAQAVALTKDYFQFPEKILLASLTGMDFALKISQDLKQEIERYYQLVGKPLDETFSAFFYLDSQ